MSFFIKQLVSQLRCIAELKNHRGFVVVTGTREQCYAQARQIMLCYTQDNSLWVGETSDYLSFAISFRQAVYYLGSEKKLIIFDGFTGVDVDALGILSGMVPAGGLFVLLLPELSQLAFFKDPQYKRLSVPQGEGEGEGVPCSGRYLKRLANLILKFNDLTLINTSDAKVKTPSFLVEGAQKNQINYAHGCKTHEQLQAVLAVQKVVLGHRRRPLVITADRGRGKSAALGIAAALLMNQRELKICVTGPRKKALHFLFSHCASHLNIPWNMGGEIQFNKSSIAFFTVDQLLCNDISCGLLLVDEAAAIPTYLLEKLLAKYSRVVFSTTVHGYEGTGRAFIIKFFKLLDCLTPQWKHFYMQTPIRWSVNDPLERFIFDALLLNANPVSDIKLNKFSIDSCVIQQIDRDYLVGSGQEVILKELFGLLVFAHYKTTPFDLRHMLDGTNVRIFMVCFQSHIIAAAIVVMEGKVSKDLALQIKNGQRRIKGQVLSQSLANHLGLESALMLRMARIMRIAVHPVVQRYGVGSLLLNEIVRGLQQENIDYVGVSYGMVSDLLIFWGVNRFHPVRIGLTKEASSGLRAIMMIRALSHKGERLFKQARKNFNNNILWLLAETAQDLDSTVVQQLLLATSVIYLTDITVEDWQVFEEFTLGNRWYEDVIAVVKKVVFACCSERKIVKHMKLFHRQILIKKVVQNISWEQLSKKGCYGSGSEVRTQFRIACGAILQIYVVSFSK